ncbi:MAG: hypothetical protein QOJ99_5679 [Bryobacterales bacterium]|jgi:hypothetical protein|nr:hypothetical protein [Bryobacterales bacterium]
MNPRELLHSQTIRELADKGEPCITIVLTGDEAGDTAIEFKNAVNNVREKLAERGVEPESLLAPVEALGRDIRGETKQRGAIAIFRSPSVMEVFRSANLTQPVVHVGDRFHIRTLLALANAQKSFYILALSQNRTRLLRCTESSSEEVPFPAGVAVNLMDAMQTRKPDHVLDNRASAGPSMGSGGGVMFGTNTDAEDKDEYMLHFFMELDKATNTVLKGSNEPLVPVGVEHEIALYRRVNTYKHLAEPGVHGAPDGLEGGEMHRRALDLLENRAKAFGSQIPADFDKRVGTGHASTRIQEIIAGAWEGRISHLFFQENSQYMGTFDPVWQRVKHTDDPLDSPVDLIEAAAYQTLRHGGEVSMLPGSAMPNGVPVCALCRYPAPQNVAAPTPVETTA